MEAAWRNNDVQEIKFLEISVVYFIFLQCSVNDVMAPRLRVEMIIRAPLLSLVRHPAPTRSAWHHSAINTGLQL